MEEMFNDAWSAVGREIVTFGFRWVVVGLVVALGAGWFGKRYRALKREVASGASRQESLEREADERQREADGRHASVLASINKLEAALRDRAAPVEPAAGSVRAKDNELRYLERLLDSTPGNGRAAAKLIHDADDLDEARRIHERFRDAEPKHHRYAPPCALARVLVAHDEMAEATNLLLATQDEADNRPGGSAEYDEARDEFFLMLGSEDSPA